MITHAKAGEGQGSNVGEPQVHVGMIQSPLGMMATGKQCQDRHANAIRGHRKMQVERWNVMLVRP
jgi:hypothetical protein